MSLLFWLAELQGFLVGRRFLKGQGVLLHLFAQMWKLRRRFPRTVL